MKPKTDLMIRYELSHGMRQKLEKAFDGLDKAGIAYVSERRLGQDIFSHGDSKTERAYRALETYAARTVGKLFEGKQGREFHEKLMEVAAGQQQGILIEGLPKTVGMKGLFTIGLKAMLADVEGVNGWFRADIPVVISRTAGLGTHYFHQDGNPDMDSPDHRSFVIMGSGQAQQIKVPTVFKLTGDKDENHQAIRFRPDQLLLFNNKTLEHSPGPANADFSETRLLFRSVVNETTLTHSMRHMEYVNELMQTGSVPADQRKLKTWLMRELPEVQAASHLRN